ncbi:MAG: LysR substrate-binding domain-containing protein [Cyclobacteriaceae bacterium]
MTLNQLNYALQLKKFKNFKRAADHLSISQPALSIQIQKLEDEIGIKLFNRASLPLEVTADGELFLIRAQEIVTQSRQLENFVNELKDDFSGTLSIGIIPTLAPFLVPLFSPMLQEEYPNLQLVFKEEITEKVINQVRGGELDAGIISTPVSVYGIQAIPLFYERFYVYASSKKQIDSQEIKLKDINYDELWLLDEGNCFRDQINDFCDLKSIRKGKKFIYHSNSIDALIRIVDTRGGMTMLPELTTLSLTGAQEDSLKTISGKQKAREIGIIVTPNHDKVRYIQLLEEAVKNNIPHHMLDGSAYDVVDPAIKMD